MTVGSPLEEWTGPVHDTPFVHPTNLSSEMYRGAVWSVRKDSVDFGASVHNRDVLIHPGAVAVLAMDESDRVLLIRQYRHPVAMFLFEPPAGLLDIAGEPPERTAARELAEETGFLAGSWHTLVDLFNSPGGSSEAIRIYLARDLSEIPGGRVPTGEAEESFLPRVWLPLEEAVTAVLSGDMGSPSAVCAVLAAAEARARNWTTLRPVDTPWPARENLKLHHRIHTP